MERAFLGGVPLDLGLSDVGEHEVRFGCQSQRDRESGRHLRRLISAGRGEYRLLSWRRTGPFVGYLLYASAEDGSEVPT